jgi:hypothetical protein
MAYLWSASYRLVILLIFATGKSHPYILLGLQHQQSGVGQRYLLSPSISTLSRCPSG